MAGSERVVRIEQVDNPTAIDRIARQPIGVPRNNAVRVPSFNARQHFAEKGWELWDEAWLEEQLKLMSERGYENQVSAVVAKLLLRGKAK